MLPGLQRMEGYDYNAILTVFNMYGIEQKNRKSLFSGIRKLINVISAEKKARAAKDG